MEVKTEITEWEAENKANSAALDVIDKERKWANRYKSFKDFGSEYKSKEDFRAQHKISFVDRPIVFPLLQKLEPHFEAASGGGAQGQDESLSVGSRIAQLLLLFSFTAMIGFYWFDLAENGDNSQNVFETHRHIQYFVEYFWLCPYGSFIFWFILRLPVVCPCVFRSKHCAKEGKGYGCYQVLYNAVIYILCDCCVKKSKNQDLKTQKALLNRRLLFEAATAAIGGFVINHYNLRSFVFCGYIGIYGLTEWVAWLSEQYIASVNCCSIQRCREVNEEVDWKISRITERIPLKTQNNLGFQSEVNIHMSG